MQIYQGYSALSDFRTRKLLDSLRQISLDISHIEAKYIHFADTERALTASEDKHLKALLAYGAPVEIKGKGQLFLTVPRPGTISSWSSKATDIARNSGLSAVKRVERGIGYYVEGATAADRPLIADILHDRMVETVLAEESQAQALFAEGKAQPLSTIDILGGGKKALRQANENLGLALTSQEMDYVCRAYSDLKRNPTDTELMMFAVVNSEHCRHKIFNASWSIDGSQQPKSLFKMIKNTYEKGGEDVLSAYSDNAAVILGATAGRFFAHPQTKVYSYHREPIHTVIKVETHNHPTAIAPSPGAATGIGGEIRDEAATGRGAKSKMGLSGFSVSNLHLPGATQPWEKPYGKPARIASPLDIMLEAPIGGAAYANEFGRPNVAGYFRTFEQLAGGTQWGYHKPIMIAGGLGNIKHEHVEKQPLPVGAVIIVLGGPAMLIGLGGGAASSMQTGTSSEDLDFASVQRANAEMERRCQEVIDSCWSLGEQNPILMVHDVGAGGWSNALPELIHDSGRGAVFELRGLPNAEDNLSPMQIWCNESQERYVLGINKADLSRFEEMCRRERCPFAVVGETTKEEQLVVHDRLFQNRPIDVPLSLLFGEASKMRRSFKPTANTNKRLDLTHIKLADAIERVLHLPSVGSKKFLITIGDRTVGGLITRDQMVGPWQVPVSDVAVAASAFDSSSGEAMAMGERAPIALIDAPASARIAIGETITNLLAADIKKLSDIKLSANWMAAAGQDKEDENLFRTVKAVGEEFCPALGVTIPVGKDSLSMRSTWKDKDSSKSVTSPLSLVISGFSPVTDVNRTLSPLLNTVHETVLIAISVGKSPQPLGGSAIVQVYGQIGNDAPDVTAKSLKQFFEVITELKKANKVLAYHDRSDGGLLVTLLEMAFASRCGLEIDIQNVSGEDELERLFNEGLGAVIQVEKTTADSILETLGSYTELVACIIGKPSRAQHIKIADNKKIMYENSRSELEEWWSDTSYQMQTIRDDPASAAQEHELIKDDGNPGLSPNISFELLDHAHKSRPQVAILREQGVNGQVEMAAAFDRAGFCSVDVHMQDLIDGSANLRDFTGLVACGGFSYGDVLGAGEGWAKSILFDAALRKQFSEFFHKPDSFSLGVCNGCQALAALKELIPGASHWPVFLKNKSEQFEGRVAAVQVNDSPSIFFRGMAGSRLLVPVAHGEGRAVFQVKQAAQETLNSDLAPLQYVDNYGSVTEHYPENPNGSSLGITGLTSTDGRATILMPHPERAFMTRQLSWHPRDWQENSPWLRMFQNARQWVEERKD